MKHYLLKNRTKLKIKRIMMSNNGYWFCIVMHYMMDYDKEFPFDGEILNKSEWNFVREDNKLTRNWRVKHKYSAWEIEWNVWSNKCFRISDIQCNPTKQSAIKYNIMGDARIYARRARASNELLLDNTTFVVKLAEHKRKQRMNVVCKQ